MSGTNARSRTVWVAMGLIAGLGLAWVWPHEPVAATATDRDARFAMTTIPVKDVTISGFRDNLDGVFVLDFLTGRLTGAVLNNKVGRFSHAYFRNVAADFNDHVLTDHRTKTGRVDRDGVSPRLQIGDFETSGVIGGSRFFLVRFEVFDILGNSLGNELRSKARQPIGRR